MISSSKKLRLFAYGTLKRGHINHKLLVRAPRVADGHTVKKLIMVKTRTFPLIFDQALADAPMLPVRGEIYEIDQQLISALDALEDLGGMYDRKVFKITTTIGTTVSAMIYVGRPVYWKSRRLQTVNPSCGFYSWNVAKNCSARDKQKARLN